MRKKETPEIYIHFRYVLTERERGCSYELKLFTRRKKKECDRFINLGEQSHWLNISCWRIMTGEEKKSSWSFSRFQNRRTKWKKTENISNAEAAEHKLGTRKMSSTSSSSLDHHRTQPVPLPTGSSISSKSSSCSSVSSHRSDKRTYNGSSTAPSALPPPPPPFPTLYFNPFTHLLQASCSSNQDKVQSPTFEERCCSVSSSTSPHSPLAIPEITHCSPSSSSTPLNETSDDRGEEDEEDDENTKPQIDIKERPCSR